MTRTHCDRCTRIVTAPRIITVEIGDVPTTHDITRLELCAGCFGIVYDAIMPIIRERIAP
jgi:hypothetical protein